VQRHGDDHHICPGSYFRAAGGQSRFADEDFESLVDEKAEQLKDPFISVLIKPVSFGELKAGIARYLG
jgi:hypothetical protein